MLCSVIGQAQLIESLSLQLGPKIEFYNSESGRVDLIPHVDAGFGLTASRSIQEHWELKVGFYKRDFTAKYEINQFEQASGQEEVYFENYAYPGFSSYQLAVMPSYLTYLSQNSALYYSAGLVMYINKKLNRKGTETRTDVILDADQMPVSSLEMTTYANQFEGGNFFIRSEIGYLHNINDYLAFDVSLNFNFSSLEHQSFKLEFTDDLKGTTQDRIYTRGLGLGLNVGVKIDLDFRD
ncbi:MAG: hypothetical protein JXR19_04455 [Bacteroidia bacterium]